MAQQELMLSTRDSARRLSSMRFRQEWRLEREESEPADGIVADGRKQPSSPGHGDVYPA